MLQVVLNQRERVLRHRMTTPERRVVYFLHSLPQYCEGIMKKLLLLLLLLFLIAGCSYKPLHDPESSTAKNGLYDDWQHCIFLVEKQTSEWEYGWYETKYISQCLKMRGHTILNGEE